MLVTVVCMLSLQIICSHLSELRPCRGTPIWPCPVPAVPGQDECERCSGPLEFRLQLMPPLMPMLEEAASWLGSTDTADIEWDWVTVGVFVCAGGCCPEDGLAEGHVVLINEQ